jgi:hypothetical protein
MTFTKSRTGVRLADDFRDNLIIDRYNPDLLAMRGSKTASMRSENSEDVLTWNVFRSLAQIAPAFWFPRLHRAVFGTVPVGPSATSVGIHLWRRIQPPPALRNFQKDEGESEFDVIIETEYAVWCIEAKFKSDVSERTTSNALRDQVIRNLDVGSWYAGVRPFDFSLLVLSEDRTPKGAGLVGTYAKERPQLPHRPDGLANLRGVALMRWRQVAEVLRECAQAAPVDERPYATKALAWMKERSIIAGDVG